MKSVIDCPRCALRVSVPNHATGESWVRCRMCNAEYQLKEALEYSPPELELIDTGASSRESMQAEPKMESVISPLSLMAESKKDSGPTPSVSEMMHSGMDLEETKVMDHGKDLEETVAFGFEDNAEEKTSNSSEEAAMIETELTGAPEKLSEDDAFDFLSDAEPSGEEHAPTLDHASDEVVPVDDDPFMGAMMDDEPENMEIQPVDFDQSSDEAATEKAVPAFMAKENGAKTSASTGMGAGGIPVMPPRRKRKQSIVSKLVSYVIGLVLAIVIGYYGILMWGMSLISGAQDPFQIAKYLPEAMVPASLHAKKPAPKKMPTPSDTGSKSDVASQNSIAADDSQKNNPMDTPADSSSLEMKGRSERMLDQKKSENPTGDANGTTSPAPDVNPAPDKPEAKPDSLATIPPMNGGPPMNNEPTPSPFGANPPNDKPTPNPAADEKPKPSDAPSPDKPFSVNPPAITPEPFGKTEPEAKADKPPMKDPTNDPFSVSPMPMPATEPTKPADNNKPADSAKNSDPFGVSEPPKPAEPATTSPFGAATEQAKPMANESKHVYLNGEKKYSEGDLESAIKKAKESSNTMTGFYSALAEVGEKASFVNVNENQSKVDQQVAAASDMLKDLLKDEAKSRELSKLAPAWMAWDKRTSNGILITGLVQESAQQGKLFVSKVHLTLPEGQVPVNVDVVSPMEFKKGSIALVGAIIEKPTAVIPDFTGTDHQVIWASAIASP